MLHMYAHGQPRLRRCRELPQVLSTIQQISQMRLNGMPRIMGSTRSQSATERHMAAKGIRPRSRAPDDGFFTAQVH